MCAVVCGLYSASFCSSDVRKIGDIDASKECFDTEFIVKSQWKEPSLDNERVTYYLFIELSVRRVCRVRFWIEY